VAVCTQQQAARQTQNREKSFHGFEGCEKNESAFYLVFWGMSLVDLLGVGLAFVVPRLAANLFTLIIEQKGWPQALTL
jgi:hypothetical protein